LGRGLERAAEATLERERFVGALYQQHGIALRTFIRRQSADRDQVEDAVQETMLRAWQTLDPAGSTDVRPWLFVTARNLLVDRWRAERRRPELVVDEVRLARATAMTAALDAALDRWLVLEAMRRLSVKHREVIVELYYRGRSVRETAQVLAITEGTVKSRHHYAIRALRTAFDELEATPVTSNPSQEE
jgi:RNA polymerase sigma-70 factor (ECF subfamily)